MKLSMVLDSVYGLLDVYGVRCLRYTDTWHFVASSKLWEIGFLWDCFYKKTVQYGAGPCFIPPAATDQHFLRSFMGIFLA